MAGDWIKMRAALMQSPRLVRMARTLHLDAGFRDWLTPGGAGAENGQLVSDDALRCVTAALLLRVWSAGREFGKYRGRDLILAGIEASDIDMMAGAPGIGAAMKAAGWLQELDEGGVILPNFEEHNAPMSNAEKQSAYRTRKRDTQSVTEVLPRVGNNSVTREEKRREEKTPPPPPEVSEAPPLAPVVEWSDIDQEVEAFVTRWNSLKGVKPLSPRALPNDIRRAGFQSTWLSPTWRPVAERALQRLVKPLPRGPDGEVRQVSIRHFFEKQSTIQELADGTHSWLNAQAGLRSGRAGAKRITDTRETYDLPTVDVDAFLAARDAERPS